MKQIIICLIICFGLLEAADVDCIERLVRGNQKYYKCAGEYSDDFTYWLTKFLNYGSYNSTDVDEISVKSSAICEKFALHIECIELRLVTISAKCLSDYLLNEQSIAFKRNLLNYFCDNEARKLQDILANNSYEIVTAGNINYCMADIDESQLFTDEDATILLNVDYVCRSLPGLFTCIKTSVETAQNKNLKNIFQDIFTIINNMLECSTK